MCLAHSHPLLWGGNNPLGAIASFPFPSFPYLLLAIPRHVAQRTPKAGVISFPSPPATPPPTHTLEGTLGIDGDEPAHWRVRAHVTLQVTLFEAPDQA